MTELCDVSTAARHAELYRHAVVARLLARLPAEEKLAPWLDEYRALSDVDGDQEIDELEAGTAAHLPLVQLERSDALVLMAAGLIEEDIRFGSLFAALQAPLAARRPCFGLLGWLLAGGPMTAGEVMERCQRLARAGLLMVDNPADPRSEWVARLPVAVWDLLSGGTIAASSLPPSLELRPALVPPARRGRRPARAAGEPAPDRRAPRFGSGVHPRRARPGVQRPPDPARGHRKPARA